MNSKNNTKELCGEINITIYNSIELVGTSEKNFSDAAKAAYERARKTLRGIRNMEIIQRDVKVKEDQNKLVYRVRVKITFQYEKKTT